MYTEIEYASAFPRSGTGDVIHEVALRAGLWRALGATGAHPVRGCRALCQRGFGMSEGKRAGVTEGLDDVQLVAALGQRNPAALATLYDRYSGLVFRLAQGLLGERASAEAVVFETF